MEEVRQSQAAQWVEHTNDLLWAHARIHRGDQGLRDCASAFACRVAMRESATPLSEGGRLASLLAPVTGVYSALRLVRHGWEGRALRHELTQLKREIEDHQGVVSRLTERKGSHGFTEYHFPCGDHSYYANGALRIAADDIDWINAKSRRLSETERLSYSSALALTAWNLTGALGLYSLFRPLPSGRWLLCAGGAAAATTGLTALLWLSTVNIACCGGRSEEDGCERVSSQFEPNSRTLLNSIDPTLPTVTWNSEFGKAMIYQRTLCIKMVREGESLSFRQPISFIWQDGGSHIELTNESELDWRGEALNQEYWGIFGRPNY